MNHCLPTPSVSLGFNTPSNGKLKAAHLCLVYLCIKQENWAKCRRRGFMAGLK